MKRRGQVGAVLLALTFVLSGCGEKPITLTSDEEAIIVAYSAHIISKFNTRQPDGLSYVPASRYEEDDGEESVADTETENPDETENAAEEQGASGSSSDGSSTEREEKPGVTLTEALGIAGIEAECIEKELKSSYVEPDFYALDAPEGTTFLVLHINLTNRTEQDITCDMLSKRVEFEALVNGTVKSKARTTILLNDLGTYQETIAAGATDETLLFFEVPADIISSIDSLRLTIKGNGTSKESVL